MKQTEAINDALIVAQQIINHYRHEFILPEHILLAFFSNGEFWNAVDKCTDADRLETALSEYLTEVESIPEEMELKPEYSVQFKEMCNHAAEAAIGSGAEAIGMHHILYGIFQLEESQARHILETNLEVSIPDFLNAVAGINEDGADAEDKWRRYMTPLEPINMFVGRAKETDQALRILCRKNKNNILIIGGNGVGKTAFARNLSKSINSNKSPEILRNLQVMELNTSRLLSGTQYRGDLEARIDDIMNAIRNDESIVVYVDSLKSLGGSGKGDDGMKDILSLLTPYFKSEEIRFIISATHEDIKRLQTSDGTVLSLFRTIELEEPSDEEAETIVNLASDELAAHHGVSYSFDTFEYAVQMSRRYIQDRSLPDKAIDLIDEAGAYCQTMRIGKVTKNIIDKVLSDICRSDVQASSENVKDDLYNMEERLKQKNLRTRLCYTNNYRGHLNE